MPFDVVAFLGLISFSSLSISDKPTSLTLSAPGEGGVWGGGRPLYFNWQSLEAHFI